MIRGCWKLLRGIGLLAVLACIFAAVLVVSCVTGLLSGNGTARRHGRLRIGA